MVWIPAGNPAAEAFEAPPANWYVIVVIWLIDGSLPTQIVWFVVVAADDKLISSSGETMIVPVNETSSQPPKLPVVEK